MASRLCTRCWVSLGKDSMKDGCPMCELHEAYVSCRDALACAVNHARRTEVAPDTLKYLFEAVGSANQLADKIKENRQCKYSGNAVD